jgi:hypothetical protein
LAKVHRSLRELKDHIFAQSEDQSAPGASDRVDQQVSGNPAVLESARQPSAYAAVSKRASGGRTTARKQLAKHSLKLHGDNPIVRADKPRRSGGRAKHHQAAPTGLGGSHLLIIGLPHEAMKGSARNKPNAAPGSPAFRHGGNVEHDSHASIKRRLERSVEQVSAFKRV